MSLDSQWDQRSIPLDNDKVPLPHENFDAFYSDFTQYDSMVETSLSSVQDLNISSVYSATGVSPASYSYQSGNLLEDSQNGPDGMISLPVQSSTTLKPAQLARYSKMMNLNNVAATHQTLENRKAFLQVPTTPMSSPMKNLASSPVFVPGSGSGRQMVSNQPADVCSLDVPPTPIYTPSHSPMKKSYASSSGVMGSSSSGNHMMINLQGTPLRDESESEAFFSSPSHSPNMDASPEIGAYPQFYTGVTPHLQAVNVFSASDMTPVLPDNTQLSGGNTSDSDIAWQPVLTLPSNEETQNILKNQILQGSIRPSNRRSCLPPGKVDEYLAGPNHEGLFECLYPNCGKLFRRRYNVRSHIQTHLCDRPYSCDICGSCFVRPHDLRRHEKVHAEERPHVCPCGKGFTRHDALQRHRIRMICSGGIEIPGKPKRVPAKRGRPRKNPVPTSSPPMYGYESEGQEQSPYGSSEGF